MSLHNLPLTLIEKSGLLQHGLPTEKPSQLSDCFRNGISWALKNIEQPNGQYLWVDVNVRLPINSQKNDELKSDILLISYKENNTSVYNLGFFVYDDKQSHWYNLQGKIIKVTHWMPIPSLPC